jgi:CheY-like chemotaxis protein
MLLRLKVGSVTTCGSGQAALEELESNYSAVTNTSDITTTTTNTAVGTSSTTAVSASVSGSASSGVIRGSLSSSNNSSSRRINLVLTDIQMPVSDHQ